ncbi:hypothetical protein AM506_12560 [Rossellomorea vietnamensis]|uniref:Uncharacterized protein n=1 Tax=Rossellomorea vietnamensis TaxID=218284 RepID=A0A0P6W2H7_9BACI|nr:hypothetical protein AM506_12560 [Rossellomorea vietnamensis]
MNEQLPFKGFIKLYHRGNCFPNTFADEKNDERCNFVFLTGFLMKKRKISLGEFAKFKPFLSRISEIHDFTRVADGR